MSEMGQKRKSKRALPSSVIGGEMLTPIASAALALRTSFEFGRLLYGQLAYFRSLGYQINEFLIGSCISSNAARIDDLGAMRKL
jgi:hypothetical protein